METLIRSMTGYGRSKDVLNGQTILVEIKSVNHKFFEFFSRVPRGCGFLEDKLRTNLQKKIPRGKVEVTVSVENPVEGNVQVCINEPVARSYVNALRELAETYHLSQDISAAALASYPDVFLVNQTAQDEEVLWESVCTVLDQALESFFAMREHEGHRMQQDIQGRVVKILDMIAQIECRSPLNVEEYQQKLQVRLQELLKDVEIDPQRVLTEAAIFADKTAVAEETVRLRSHLEQMATMLEQDGAVGRKLDFLVQEMNREANTIGSKAMDARISYLVVEMKAEIEKIREQIQNIE